ncbi:MAG: DNA polymerase Y family protein [Patescibacteria group bacterium]
MNSYFASVEQQANPQLRGRPLGVCAYLHKAGCVIAASVEAKQCGVKVGMSMEVAKAVCPQMKFIQNDPPKYRAVSSRVFSLFHELTDKVEHYSIDEVFLDLTGWYRDEAEAAWALCRARLRIQSEVGEWLRCSVGIAPSKFLAKLASEMQKPNGLTSINQDNLDAALATRDLEDACGIGKRIRRRLNKLGIYNLLDLKNYPVGNLIRALGIAGYYWHERLRAREIDRFESSNTDLNQDHVPRTMRQGSDSENRSSSFVVRCSIPKSVGHSFCVPKRANEQNLILPILLRLTERAGRRLRSFGRFARAMVIQVSFKPPLSPLSGGLKNQISQVPDKGFRVGSECVQTIKFVDPANDPFTLVHAATRALEQMWHGEIVTFLAVTLIDLVPPLRQLSFTLPNKAPSLTREGVGDGFALYEQTPSLGLRGGRGELKNSRTTKAIDSIRDRHGEEAIIFASMMGLSSDYAPDRIGFRKTDGLDFTVSDV